MSASFAKFSARFSAAWLALAASALAQVDYAKQVHPILALRCLACHSEEKRSGGLALATYSAVLQGGRTGAAVKPGSSAMSLLVRRITGEVQPAMPFGMDPLSAADIKTIREWIDQGARQTPTSAVAQARWEPPLALSQPAVPNAEWKTWTAPVDRFTAAYFAKHGIAEPKPAPDAIFARRVYLDTWGFLPTPEELHAFLDDRAPDKRERLIEKLLADDQKYAENWITFWNDLLRNDEGVNYAGSRKSITEWLLGSLKSNLRYDQFVNKLLNPTVQRDPDGFLVGVNWRGDINASQTPFMQAAQNSAQVFLGVNLKCNSCHDSFISRWKLKDAYALAAYFSANPKLELYRCDGATGAFAEPSFLYPELNRAIPSASLADRQSVAAAIFTDPRNGRMPRTLVNRVWQRLLGRGIVEQVDDMDAEPWSAELLDWLASDFAAHDYDVKRLISTILASRAYQMPAVAQKGETATAYVFRGPEIRRMTAEQFADTIGAMTGEWRVYQPENARQGRYTREWRVASSPLTRALGRPIRDQVVTTRNSAATTLQALELVNGESLTHWLSRGARKVLGQLPPEPASLFDSGPIRGSGRVEEPKPVTFDIDVSKSGKLWLLVEDVGSYEPELVAPAWAKAEFVGPGGVTRLADLKPVLVQGERTAEGPIDFTGSGGAGIRVMSPSRMVYDISGKRFTRFRGIVSIEKSCLRDDVQPRSRFFIFQDEPNMERLVPVGAEAPVSASLTASAKTQMVDRLFWHALGRAPSGKERHIAEGSLRSPAELADLLWSVMMTPDFQLIY